MSVIKFLRSATYVGSKITQVFLSNSIQKSNTQFIRTLSTSQPAYDINEDVNKKLMEFFDDPKYWNENEVKTGRSWQKPELRIKSNKDLHKIWYILLKELNMLKTMEHEYKREWKFWASPERIDKVRESMRNIEAVVRERNQAYHLLETGHSGEREGDYITNALGLQEYKKYTEHVIPLWRNKKWREANPRGCHGPDYQKFIKFYRENVYNEKRKAMNRDRNHIIRLLRRFPNLDREMLKEKYPGINFDALNKKDLFRGHYIPRIE